MKAIKALVAFMGVLLVAGLALLGYGLYHQAPKLSASSAAVAAHGYFTSEVSVPPGGHLEQMAVAGDRVILRFSGNAGAAEQILVVDPQSGQIAGTITLVPQAPR